MKKSAFYSDKSYETSDHPPQRLRLLPKPFFACGEVASPNELEEEIAQLFKDVSITICGLKGNVNAPSTAVIKEYGN